jgi:hypothetical protein
MLPQQRCTPLLLPRPLSLLEGLTNGKDASPKQTLPVAALAPGQLFFEPALALHMSF